MSTSESGGGDGRQSDFRFNKKGIPETASVEEQLLFWKNGARAVWEANKKLKEDNKNLKFTQGLANQAWDANAILVNENEALKSRLRRIQDVLNEIQQQRVVRELEEFQFSASSSADDEDEEEYQPPGKGAKGAKGKNDPEFKKPKGGGSGSCKGVTTRKANK